MSDIFAKLITPKRIHIILGIFVVANILATLKIVSDRTFFNSSDFIAYSIGAQMILDGQGKNSPLKQARNRNRRGIFYNDHSQQCRSKATSNASVYDNFPNPTKPTGK